MFAVMRALGPAMASIILTFVPLCASGLAVPDFSLLFVGFLRESKSFAPEAFDLAGGSPEEGPAKSFVSSYSSA